MSGHTAVLVVGDRDLAAAVKAELDRTGVAATVGSVAVSDPVSVIERAAATIGCLVVDGRGADDRLGTVTRLARQLPEIPVVYVTEGGNPERLESALEAGASEVCRTCDGEVPIELLGRRVARWLRGDLVSANETLDALHGVTRRLVRAEDRDDAVEIAVEAAARVLGFPGTAIRLADEEEGVLRGVAFAGSATEAMDSLPPYDLTNSPHGRAYNRGETIVRESEPDDPDPFERTMYIPLSDHGVLSVGRTEPGDFDRTDVQFAEILGRNTTAALDRVERERRLRTQQAELRERNERLDEFASFLSHDLRNPLSVALGHVQMADSGGDLEAAERALGRMERLIEDALAFAREGSAVTEPAPVALADLAAEVWRDRYDDAAATLEVSVPDHYRLNADPDRLRRLLANLLGNAVQHGGDGVTIHVELVDDGQGFVIHDDGPGIPEDEVDDVFERGYTTRRDGTGLGLAIVGEIGEAHGWTIEAGEGPAGGASFTVRGAERVKRVDGVE